MSVRRGDLGLVQVALHEQRAGDEELAGLAGRGLCAVAAPGHDAHVADGPADGADARVELGRRQDAEPAADLGEPVHVEEAARRAARGAASR